MTASWLPPAAELNTTRLVLEPLRVEHAAEIAPVLDDESLHTWTGGRPATPDALVERYRRQVVGHSADGTEQWLNWVLRRRDDGTAAGFVQAGVRDRDGSPVAEVAWVVGSAHQGQGLAREAAGSMCDWLREQGAAALVAHVHPDHAASSAAARGVGLRPTDDVVDGEVVWTDAQSTR